MSDPTKAIHHAAEAYSTAADAYVVGRPDYPPEVTAWLLDELGLGAGRIALDLGAGTGTFTKRLVATGAQVIAVEPVTEMLARLSTALPRVEVLNGTATQIPLADASVDAVVSGNAMHWFDMRRAGPEIARVLAPGGVLAGLWNLFDTRVPWVADLARVGGPEAVGPRDTPATWRAATAGIVDSLAGFGPADSVEIAHAQRRTAGSLVATIATKAGILVLPEEARAARLAQVAEHLARTPETADGAFSLPLLTAVLRTRLL